MPKSWSYVPPADGLRTEHARTAVLNAPEPDGLEFTVRTPVRDLTSLVVSDGVRQRLDTAIHLVKYHDVLFNQWDLKSIDPHRQGIALNLYGPPGTGKTLAAEALAAHLGHDFIDISYAEIESRYVGETPKNIVRCFEAARRHDAVLVFNEADSILGSRLSSVTQSADHSVNVSRAVMLAQLDEFTGIVVFTSNFPKNYDTAFVRRILAHVRFDLPDQPTRRRLWAVLLPKRLPLAADVNLDLLAEASDGLAGGDLVNVILAAATKAVDRPVDDYSVHLVDLLDEITELRNVKQEVGRPQAAGPVAVWNTVAAEDARSDITRSGEDPARIECQ
ncbi:MAG: ATP-binding protein [Pseudonocardiales bacterium]|nr:ATP-binding protein [Pseudonocardiales bacterium]